MSLPSEHADKEPDFVWGAKAIGEVLNRSPRQVYYMADLGLLPGVRKVGKRLLFADRRLLQTISQQASA
jgi:hypothetical protein